ncbi:hypothetical protein [Halovivax limisalsi]|uniref:hypothetical protein n=1 Tax=Halovivax limisalsi TaxID=1453760 RepID=UPI001FFCE986|nr:hypothetical protein [Halovivax limisalsi]
MRTRTLVGALGTLTILGAVALGAYTLLVEYGFDAAGNDWRMQGLATLLLAALVVASLSFVGSRGGGRLDTPYW